MTFKNMQKARESSSFEPEQIMIILAFTIVYIVWGSTYLANYLAIQTIPPFIMSGSRFLTAGILLFSFSRIRTKTWPSWEHWRNALWVGILFLSIGTGGVVWAEQYVATGIASLIVAFEPLVVVFMMWVFLKKVPSYKSIIGVALGILGMFFLVDQEEFIANRDTVLGIVVIGLSISTWAYATVQLPKFKLPDSRFQSAAIQMIAGGVSLLIFAYFVGEYNQFEWQAIDRRSFYSWLYLIFFGSILAYSAFNYLLLKVAADKVATSNYVNPVVALWLGWAFNNEHLSNQSLLAAALLLVGVFLIVSRR